MSCVLADFPQSRGNAITGFPCDHAHRPEEQAHGGIPAASVRSKNQNPGNEEQDTADTDQENYQRIAFYVNQGPSPCCSTKETNCHTMDQGLTAFTMMKCGLDEMRERTEPHRDKLPSPFARPRAVWLTFPRSNDACQIRAKDATASKEVSRRPNECLSDHAFSDLWQGLRYETNVPERGTLNIP